MSTTIPGGYYLSPDGTPHDAWGNPVEPMEEEADPEAPDQDGGATDAASEGDPFASEAARQMAELHGLSPSEIEPTGATGITKPDVERAIE